MGEVQADGPAGSFVVPDGVDLRTMVARLAGDPVAATARVRVRTGACWALRSDASTVTPDGDGWDVVEVGYSDPERLADRVAGFGADVVVLSPDEARDAVVRRLQAAAQASQDAVLAGSRA